MDLKQQLSESLASKLKIIEQEAEKIWQKGELNHVYYTLHGINHSNAVIKILNDLVEGIDPGYKLKETEIFCLLAASYLHDVGMQYKFADDEIKVKEISELKGKSYTLQDLIRDQHHQRSDRYIRENAEILKLDHIESYCVGLIAKGHRKEDLTSNIYENRSIGNNRIRVRLLSVLLRLSDELDICYTRAPEIIYNLLKDDMPEYSKLQWLKHYYTAGVLIEISQEKNKRPSTVIEIECRYPSHEVKDQIVELILSPIEKTIEEIKEILLDFGLNIKLEKTITYDHYLKKIPDDLLKIYFKEDKKKQDEKINSTENTSIDVSFSSELPKIRRFIGRSEELKQLSNALKSKIIVIEGIPGVGKTYIAAKFAERLKEEYTVYWYENHSAVCNLGSVINRISAFFLENGRPKLAKYLEVFGPNDREVLIKLFKDELNSGNFAIFFDDYHKNEEELKPLLEQLLDLKSSRVIVITRQEPNFYTVVDERETSVMEIYLWCIIF